MLFQALSFLVSQLIYDLVKLIVLYHARVVKVFARGWVHPFQVSLVEVSYSLHANRLIDGLSLAFEHVIYFLDSHDVGCSELLLDTGRDISFNGLVCQQESPLHESVSWFHRSLLVHSH